MLMGNENALVIVILTELFDLFYVQILFMTALLAFFRNLSF